MLRISLPPLVLSAAVAWIALPAAAQDVVLQPRDVPAAEAPAPAGYPVFYEEADSRAAPTGFDLPWQVRKGADAPFDVDPRDSLVIDQPLPLVSFELR